MVRVLTPDGRPVLGPENQSTSNNWSGYAVTGGTYTSVSGSWTVPSVSYANYGNGAAREYSSTWVGIGGYGTSDLIQLGTAQEVTSSGATTYYAWYEMLPANEIQLNPSTYPVSAGDSISASVTCTSSCSRGSQQTFSISITNQSRGWTWSGTFSYTSGLSSAEWIHEAVTVNGSIASLPSFSSFSFSGATVNGSNPNLNLASNGIILNDPAGGTAAPCAAVNGNQFQVVYGNNSCPAGPASLIVAQSTNMLYTGNQGGPFNPGSFSYTLSASSGTLNYQISNVPGWITASSTSGSVGTSGTTITFTINAVANSLGQGTYGPTAVSFTNATNGNGTTTRTVTTVVNPPPQTLRLLSSDNYDGSGLIGGPFDPTSIQYGIYSSSGTISYSINGVPSWMNASATSGSLTTTPIYITFSLNASANSLNPGTYGPININFINNTTGLGNATRTATLTVYPVGTPQLVVTPAGGQSATGPEGGPFSPSSLQFVMKASSGSVGYSITGYPAWLTPSSTSGTATTSGTPVNFTINAAANDFTLGNYAGTITLKNTTNKLGNTTRPVTVSINSSTFGLLPHPAGFVSSWPRAMNKDGSVMVGSGCEAINTQCWCQGQAKPRPVLWYQNLAAPLPMLSGYDYGYATAVSGDGTVISGTVSNCSNLNSQAVRWANGSVAAFGGSTASVQSINRDGSFLVGYSGATGTGVRWTSNGTSLNLPAAAGHAGAYSYDMSDNGAIVVGSSGTSYPNQEATVWTINGSTVTSRTLGIRATGDNNSIATAITPDGSKIAVLSGNSQSGTYGGYLVTAAGNVDLGLFQPSAISDAGNALIDQRGYRWTAAGGAQTINALLAAKGVDVGYMGTQPYAISADGSIIVGVGFPNGEAQGWRAQISPNFSHALSSHDFNGDGNSDITLRHSSGAAGLWLMSKQAVAVSAGYGGIPPSIQIVGQRDFNGDGKADWLWRGSDGALSMWFMNGTQAIASTSFGIISPAWSVAGTGDLNGDGKADILWRDTLGNVAIWLMNGPIIAASVVLGNVPIAWTVAGVGDFDGDGKADILWRDTSGYLALWFMNGGQVLSSSIFGPITTAFSVAATGDFNADGKTDILWRDSSGNIAIWLMNGATVKKSAVLGTVTPAFTIAGTGDFNGDSKADILWRDTSGNIALWFMNGTTIASSAVVNSIGLDWTIQSANSN